MHREAEMIEQQLKVKQTGQPTPGGGGGGMPNGPAGGGQPSQQSAMGGGQQSAQMQGMGGGGGGAGGQPDYSAQWAEYYRSIGKLDDAEAIENQLKLSKVNILLLLFNRIETIFYIYDY